MFKAFSLLGYTLSFYPLQLNSAFDAQKGQ